MKARTILLFFPSLFLTQFAYSSGFAKVAEAGKENLKVLNRISLELPISEERKTAIQATEDVWKKSLKDYKDSTGKEKSLAYKSLVKSYKVLLSELKAVCEELKIISESQLSGLTDYIFEKNPTVREKEKFMEIYELSKRESRQAQITYHASHYRYSAQQFERAIKLSRKVYSITGAKEPDQYFFKVNESGEKIPVNK